jgi:hypothetical protein
LIGYEFTGCDPLSQTAMPSVWGDELCFAENVGLRQPSDLPLADDVHCFVSSDRAQSAIDGPEPLTGNHALLHKAMLLYVVQVWCLTASASLIQLAGLLELIDRGGIRSMAIHPWLTLARLQNRRPEKFFWRR